MRVSLHPPTIDRRRAQRALTDAAQLLLAALPFVLGFVAGLLWRLLVLLWLILLWVFGAVLAGWDMGRGKRQ